MAGLNDPLTQLDYGVEYQRGPQSVTQASGLAGLAAPTANDIARSNANALNDMRNFGAASFDAPRGPAPAPAPLTKPVLAISRSTGKIWANGKLFTTDDAQGAVESEQYLAAPPQPAPAAEAGDWEPLSVEALTQHISKIKNPGLGTLASKNFGIGVDNMQMLAGYGAQFLGAEEFGKGVVQTQLEEVRKNAPYQRNFTDIGSEPNRGYLDWFVANLAQQGPNIVESVVTAAVGAAAGGAAGGGPNPFTAAGGAITAMVGKQAFKQALLGAAKKYAAGEALDAAEAKLLREAAGLTAAARKELFEKVGTATVDKAGTATMYTADDAIKAANSIVGAGSDKILAGGLSQARAGGAALATGAQNYATGVADLYGESVEGGDPSRGLAALGGIPYAAMETVPEYLAALRFFKGIGLKAAKTGAKGGRTGAIATNMTLGAGAGAALEGTTELGQESLGIGMNDAIDMDSPEGISRLLNAFAAGAAIGGAIGAGSSMNTGKPHDMLTAGTQPAAPGEPPALDGEIIAPSAPRSPVGPDGSIPLLGAPDPAAAAGPMGLPGPTPAPTPDVTGVQFGQTQMGAAPAAQALPGASTIYNPAPTPSPMLTGPVVAPSAPPPPDVIPMGGPQQFGSALQQVAAGDLTQAIPTGPTANRLQQQTAAAQAAARQQQLEATSGSALAQLGRGEMVPPINEPGGRISMGGDVEGQMVEPLRGKAKLKRGKKALRVEGMPVDATATQTDDAPMTGTLEPEVIPYDTLTYDGKLKKAVPSSGSSRIIDMAGRKIITVNINGVRIPFYLSTGLGGKTGVKAGKWYPFFGIGPSDGWFNKTSEAQINSYYNSPELRAAAEELDRTYGDIRSDDTIPKVKAEGAHVDFINADLNPTDNGTPETGQKMTANVNNTLARIRGEQPNAITPEPVQAAEPKPKTKGEALKRGKKAEVAEVEETAADEVSAFPVHDKFIAELDDARLNDEPKSKLKAIAKRAVKQGVLTEKQVSDMDYLFKDRDMSADDIVPELTQQIELNKEAAPDVGRAQAELKRKGTDSSVPKGKAKLFRLRDDTSPEEGDSGRAEKGGKAPGKAEDKIKETASPKAEGVASPAKKADAPSTAVAVVEPKQIEDTEKQRKAAKAQAEMDEMNTLAKRAENDMAEVEAMIETLDYTPPESEDYAIALVALLEFAKGSDTRAPRKRAIDYLKTIPPEDIRVAERTMVVSDARRLAAEERYAATILGSEDADPEAKQFAQQLLNDAKRAKNKAKGVLAQQAEEEDAAAFDLISTTMAQFNSGEITSLTQSQIGRLKTAWMRIKDKGKMVGNVPLAAYIKKSDPRFFNIVKGKIEPQGEGRYSISQWDTPDNPVPAGRIKLIIQKFVSKLAMKPKVYVFRNQADLKASDPKLYARAKAGRPDGDFDTVQAAGYSLGDEIIIFSDRIGSEDHLSFVLAHETLGHFGFRGLMGGGDFDALMGKLYDADERLRASVDMAMKVRGLGKAEAVEEYLADYAGQLHTRLVLRFWKGVKSVLNRVGIKFGDEATRYLLDQSKRYVRTGQKTGVFNTGSVLRRIWAVEHGQTGRFSVLDPMGLSDENQRVAATLRHNAGIVPMNLKEAVAALADFGGTWDGFKEKFFSLTNFQALRNPGLYEFNQLLAETREREASIHNKYNERLETLLYKNDAYKDAVSRALLLGREVSVYRLIEEPLSPADRRKALFSINDEGKLVKNTKAINEYVKRGILSYDEMTKGGTYFRTYTDSSGKDVRREVKFDGMPDLTKEQYDDYVLSRETIADVELELLEAKYSNYLHSEGVSRKAINRLLKSASLEGEAAKLMKGVSSHYKEIYVSGYTVDARGNITPGLEEIEQADKFLEAVNKALIGAAPEGNPKATAAERNAINDPEVRKFFDSQKQADDFMATLEKVRDDRKAPDNDLTFLFQNEIKSLILDDLNLGVEEERAKRTMAAGYVPVIRDKAFEMRVDAVDAKGNYVKLHEDHRKLLIYSQFDTMALAKENAEMLAGEFEGKEFEALTKQDDGGYAPTKVRLRVTVDRSPTRVTADPSLNLDEFMHGLRLFNINLTPDKMRKVIRTLTEAGDPVRKRLEFSNVPGADKSTGVFAMARHIQMRAATAAKTLTKPRIRELLDKDNNSEVYNKWAGDPEGVMSAKIAMDNNPNPAMQSHYKREFDRKMFMFLETNPSAKGWDGSRAGYQKIKDKVMREQNVNRFYTPAQNMMEFLESNDLVTESNFGAGKVASRLRAATSVFQLGGSIAQGVMNMTSPYTNWMPYMMSYNSRNGFGGGFGAGAVVAEYHRALTQVGARGLASNKYNTAEYYEGLLNNPAELASSGLTKEEAAFLAEEIREGKLIPAQSNALLGTARAGITNAWGLRTIDAFMAPFNRTEQASRRAAALAAFRLDMRRNGNDATKARTFAIQSLDLTLGEYSVLNRPPAWRDGIQSFLYMYKVYPTTTIQLFRRLDKKGQIIMLGSMLMMAGLPGLPFAEDLEDLIDTIAQMLGLQMGSIRAEFAKALDEIAPGLTPVVLKGFINGYLGVPADVAGRFSMGDFVPGTGFLLAGATIGEEVKDILGPMPAMVIGATVMARDLITAPLSEGKTFQDALRNSPVTLGRMVGDTWAYWDNGAVVDKRGYVVSPEMNMGMMAYRLLGFYPRAAADQYEAIKIAKRVNNYQKEVVAYHRYAWVKSMQTGNRAYAREIERAVEEWNRGAKGTSLEIKDFVKNSQRALKEAQMSAVQRTLRSTAKAGREDTERMTDLLIQ